MTDRAYRQCTGIHVAELAGDETVARTPDEQRAVILNPTASAVVELCAVPRTLDDLVDVLAGVHAATSRAQIETDTRAVLDQLTRAGILEES